MKDSCTPFGSSTFALWLGALDLEVERSYRLQL